MNFKKFNFFTGIFFGLVVTCTVAMSWERCESLQKKNSTIECCLLANNQFEAIDTKFFFCCNGSVHRHSKNLKCCHQNYNYGSELYDPTKSKCCNGRIQNIPQDGAKKMECCGDVLYDARTELCCPLKDQIEIEYRVFGKKNSTSECPLFFCNKQPYNPEEKMCCHEKLLPAPKNHGCCGKDLYNTKTQICCDGEKHWKRKESDSPEKCCGQKYIQNGEKCCGQKIVSDQSACCGGKTYNKSLFICSADSQLVPFGTPLCGERPYDPEQQVCCGYFPMKKNHPNDNKCCKPRGFRPGVTFNDKNMTCKDGQLFSTVKCTFEHKPENYTCCNGYAYKKPARNSVCCQGRAEWLEWGSGRSDCRAALCQGQWFDDVSMECCSEKLIRKNRLRCIDGKPYKYFNRNMKYLTDLFACGQYAISTEYSCCAGTMPFLTRRYSCPFNNFGSQRPVKPRHFPFWLIIECRSKKKSGKIVQVIQTKDKMILKLKEIKSQKDFSILISGKQQSKILRLRNKMVTVYYEKSVQNELTLGEYGAIESQRNAKRRIKSSIECETIDRYFQSNSS